MVCVYITGQISRFFSVVHCKFIQKCCDEQNQSIINICLSWRTICPSSAYSMTLFSKYQQRFPRAASSAQFLQRLWLRLQSNLYQNSYNHQGTPGCQLGIQQLTCMSREGITNFICLVPRRGHDIIPVQ